MKGRTTFPDVPRDLAVWAETFPVAHPEFRAWWDNPHYRTERRYGWHGGKVGTS